MVQIQTVEMLSKELWFRICRSNSAMQTLYRKFQCTSLSLLHFPLSAYLLQDNDTMCIERLQNGTCLLLNHLTVKFDQGQVTEQN